MSKKKPVKAMKRVLVAAFAGSLVFAQGTNSSEPSSTSTVDASSPYHPNRFPKRAALRYSAVWGIDSLSVKTVESGELIRFSYRVVDAQRAKVLNNKDIEPSLIDPQAKVSLVIPAMEKVGKLRNVNTPEDGKSYWMAFSNRGRLVKRGDRVTVIIGQFRAEGLVVD